MIQIYTQIQYEWNRGDRKDYLDLEKGKKKRRVISWEESRNVRNKDDWTEEWGQKRLPDPYVTKSTEQSSEIVNRWNVYNVGLRIESFKIVRQILFFLNPGPIV
ncbi:MAG: hypothetical protein EZS28_029786 [Streblomastix strix]|uniref:Uncharacterized protein n=1 Tax=Streblomastix strix TaxID=222440 RepID=A0A5J4UVI7_9EUKA|nr:MAG: hypothetical protein EZS28_029786 [Streblomastix strix]